MHQHDLGKGLRWLAVFSSLLAFAATAPASPESIQFGAHLGYTLSEGVDTNLDFMGDTLKSIDPEDGMAWGASVGAILYSGWEVGFLFSRQESELVLTGRASNYKVSSMAVDNYHGIFSYNFPTYNVASPFLMFGLGATRYGGITVDGQSVSGNSRFSTTWGAGVKLFPRHKPLGLRLMIRWTPTYLKSEPGGVWCDPYWGCFQSSNPEYSNQWEFSGAVMFRTGKR